MTDRGAFLINRALRIYPTFWACLCLAILISWYWLPITKAAFPGFGTPDQFSFGNWLNQFAIIPISPKAELLGHNFKLIPQSWSLENELYFYLIIGLCTYRSKQLTLLVLCAGVFYAAMILNISRPHFYTSPGSNAFMFFAGSMAYFIAPVGLRAGQMLLVGGIAISCASMYILPLLLPSHLDVLLFLSPVGMALLLIGMPSVRVTRPSALMVRVSTYLGRLAYPVFLLHLQAQIALFALLDSSRAALGEGLIFLGSYIITLALSVLVVTFVELPIERLRSRIRSRGKKVSREPSIALRIAATAVGGGLLTVMILAIDYSKSIDRDRLRVTHAQNLRDALHRYRERFGRYPSPFMDANIVALKPDLVEKAIMPSIPEDPLWAATGRQYRYVSPDGSAYAIVLHFERASVGAEGAGCLFGVGYAGTGWYSQGGQSPPDCPF